MTIRIIKCKIRSYFTDSLKQIEPSLGQLGLNISDVIDNIIISGLQNHPKIKGSRVKFQQYLHEQLAIQVSSLGTETKAAEASVDEITVSLKNTSLEDGGEKRRVSGSSTGTSDGYVEAYDEAPTSKSRLSIGSGGFATPLLRERPKMGVLKSLK